CRSEEERKQVPGHLLVNKDHPQVIEIWNNVFIQYNRMKDGSLQPLAATHVDTGMGLERLVRVLQKKSSNYDTDIFSGSISTTEKIAGKTYTAGDAKQDVAFRVLADHIRAIAFTIADGQLPSNTGAGYVIRRILRRAVRYYYSYLDVKEPLLHKLLPGLAEQFKDVFSELHAQLAFVTKVVKEEEETFLRTLGKGLKKMDELLEASKPTGRINGAAAFELYDTYGFPIDLTRLIAQEHQMEVDEPGFEQEMQIQKNRSRAATAADVEDWVEVTPAAVVDKFVGYHQLTTETSIVKYRKVTAKGQSNYQVVLNQTPFYAESGGQVGDTGSIAINGNTIAVLNTKKENDLIVHTVEALPEQLNGNVTAVVDAKRRMKIACHHSLTHLLHAALRQVLGTHVAQKGSLVNDAGMRFDFSHFAKMSDEEIASVVSIVNQKIRENIPVVIKEMPKEEALQLGAMALFGEKYGDRVRVVIIDPTYSVELCGGTHVMSTGELGYCVITSETGVAAGVRRIEAVVGEAAEKVVNDDKNVLMQIASILKNPRDLVKAVENQQDEHQALKKQLESVENKLASFLKTGLAETAIALGDIQFIGQVVEVTQQEMLKKLCNDLRSSSNNAVVALAAVVANKPFVAIGISDDLVTAKNLDATVLIKSKVAGLIKGGGGGQKTLATAGGQDASNLNLVLEQIKQSLS
ncbi:MAG: alanine--tRNA ligase, partial [Chitinophagaceae bacterium]